MDEFKELEKELEKLRRELNLLDNSATSGPMRMDTSDYWRRRLEEEKLLWDKKIAFADAEKKHLTEKMLQQENQLRQYQEQLKKLQEQMERESHLWEERLRAKETDLMLEKNRLLWEDKIRQTNLEMEKYLKEISELNQQIVKLKDEQQQEKEKLLDQFSAEKRNLEEKISLLSQEINLRESAYQELKNKFHAGSEELNKKIQELDNYQKQQQKLGEKITQLEEEKKAILREQQIRQKNLEEKTLKLQQWLNQQAGLIENFINNFSRLNRKEKITYLKNFQKQLTAGPETETTFALTIPRKARALPYLLTALVLTIVLAIWPKINYTVKNLRQKLNYSRIYEIAYPHPSGIYFDGKDIWISDWQGQAIYRHTPGTLYLKKIYYLPGLHLNAISGNDQYLYGYDGWNQTIYQFQKNGYLNIRKKINLKEIFPSSVAVNFSGIAVNAKYLWASDVSLGRIYEIDLDEKKINNTYALAAPVSGLAFYDGKIYLLDGKNWQILKYDLKSGQKQKIMPLPDSYRKNFSPTALTLGNNYCWIISEKDSRIYRYSLPLKEVSSESH